MARFEAGTDAGRRVHVYTLPPEGATGSSRIMDCATACDTDEGWVNVLVLDKSGRSLAADGHLLRARVHCSFEVRDKDTGAVLATYRKK